MTKTEAGMTKSEVLLQTIAEQFYGGYCDPFDRDGDEWQDALENADQLLTLLKESGLKFIPSDFQKSLYDYYEIEEIE